MRDPYACRDRGPAQSLHTHLAAGIAARVVAGGDHAHDGSTRALPPAGSDESGAVGGRGGGMHIHMGGAGSGGEEDGIGVDSGSGGSESTASSDRRARARSPACRRPRALLSPCFGDPRVRKTFAVAGPGPPAAVAEPGAAAGCPERPLEPAVRAPVGGTGNGLPAAAEAARVAVVVGNKSFMLRPQSASRLHARDARTGGGLAPGARMSICIPVCARPPCD